VIITRTPYRVSFLGGGSDIAGFYENTPGMVISTSIQQYMYISVHPSFNPRETRVKYSKIESVENIEDLEHPIVKAVLRKLNVQGVEISSIGDIPAQTGLGSSSSFAVGLLQAIHAYKGEVVTKEELAKEACEIEIEILREPIGKQDQYAAAYGGLKQFTFNSNGSVDVDPILISDVKRRELEESLLLFFTGITRSASKVLEEQSKNIATDQDKAQALRKMVSMVPDLRAELEKGNIDSLGRYLDEGWEIKRSLASSISNPDIDETYKKARSLGAVGGKILGAGGGGFFLLYCPKAKQEHLIKDLGLKHLPVKFDDEGAQIVYSA
jgi:D-glycero-alpha-D-manno-heptose-7-phosphate kinase